MTTHNSRKEELIATSGAGGKGGSGEHRFKGRYDEIVMTHTTREWVKEMLPTEMDLEKVGQHYWGGDYEPTYQELINLKQSFKEILTPKIEKVLHQELQKARENTLKEVIKIIESVQVTAQKMSADDTRPEKAKMINDWLMPEVKRNIIKAIQSELDQPTSLNPYDVRVEPTNITSE